MARYQGGERVKAGFYLGASSWAVTTLSGEGGTLPGGAGAQYVRMPAIGLLLFAPLMGAAYAMFLPFIGIVLVAQHATKKAVAAVRGTTESVVETMSPAWRPGEAHFTGSPDKDATRIDGGAAPEVEARLKRIEDEIDHADKR
jgi:hypothetical protein